MSSLCSQGARKASEICLPEKDMLRPKTFNERLFFLQNGKGSTVTEFINFVKPQMSPNLSCLDFTKVCFDVRFFVSYVKLKTFSPKHFLKIEFGASSALQAKEAGLRRRNRSPATCPNSPTNPPRDVKPHVQIAECHAPETLIVAFCYPREPFSEAMTFLWHLLY